MKNYCPAWPSDAPSYFTGNINRLVNAITTISCAAGYVASSNGPPTYQCVADSASSGKWQLLGGGCVGVLLITGNIAYTLKFIDRIKFQE